MPETQELVDKVRLAIESIRVENEVSTSDMYYVVKQAQRQYAMPIPQPEAIDIPEELPPPPEGATPPTITSLTPDSTEVGQATALTVSGTGFDATSEIQADGNALATTFVSASELTTFVPGPLAPGSVEITVTTGALTSSGVPFEATAPVGRKREPEYGRDDRRR